MGTFTNDHAWSRQIFEDHLLIPIASDYLADISLPDETDKIGMLLDRHADIDAVCLSGPDVYGLGYRIQRGQCYSTFTIRAGRSSGKMTQLAKLKRAMQSGGFYPKLTVQAYVSQDRIIYAVGDTEKIIETLDIMDEQRVAVTNHDGSSFVVVPWSECSPLWCSVKEIKLNTHIKNEDGGDYRKLDRATPSKPTKSDARKPLAGMFSEAPR